MLHLLLLYFIGKRFYDLSIEYNQKKWLYAILSIVVYYGAALFLGFALAILDLLFEWGIDWENSFGWNLLGIPAGLLAVWGFYVILENKWKKSIVIVKGEIQDIGKNIEE
jgi:H+/Cl- antiporter ClcA